MTSSRIEITEATAIIRARSFVRSCGIDTVPVDLSKFLAGANAEFRISRRLAPGESGNTMYVGDRHLINVNGNDTPERQRFTVLHELGHIVLELPSRHGETVTAEALYSYAKRPREEVLCDTFAAECLLPHEFLRRDIIGATAGFSFIDEMAEKYKASLACTASRIAINAPFACAYVLSQDGHIRFPTYSASMREARFWVSPGIAIPTGSITGQCIKAGATSASGTVPGYLWTACDDFANVDLHEETRVIRGWNQALTLLSLDAGDPIGDRRNHLDSEEDDEPLLRELDGLLPWPGKKR